MTDAMTKPTIVLVHGAWADGSSWDAVTRALQAQGYTVLVPPNLLRGLTDDAAYLTSFLAQRTSGPVVLVGHSYGGAVITNAATAGDVRALVYVNAFMPDEGETVLQILDGSASGRSGANDPCTTSGFRKTSAAPSGAPGYPAMSNTVVGSATASAEPEPSRICSTVSPSSGMKALT